MSDLDMSSQPQPSFEPAARASTRAAPERRQSLVRILFIHRYLADVERCLHELKRLRYTVSSDVVLTPGQFSERMQAEVYDTVIAEYPSSNWQETQALDILRDMKKNIPLVFLVHGLKREMAAELILKGAADCIEVDIGYWKRRHCATNATGPKRICDARRPATARWWEIEATEFAAAARTEDFWK
jgi:hypothetical protein